jgi:hypothetical protein
MEKLRIGQVRSCDLPLAFADLLTVASSLQLAFANLPALVVAPHMTDIERG